MPRIYFIIVEKSRKYIEAEIEMTSLPPVVIQEHRDQWWENGEDLVRWFQSDLSRATRIVTHLSTQTYSEEETYTFLTQLMSLWDASFLPRENKDAFFCAMPERGGFIRSSPEGVINMVDAMRNGLNPF
jgi:hypothetical protein